MGGEVREREKDNTTRYLPLIFGGAAYYIPPALLFYITSCSFGILMFKFRSCLVVMYFTSPVLRSLILFLSFVFTEKSD